MNKETFMMEYISEADENKRAELVAEKDFPSQLFPGVACDGSKKVKLALLENHELNVEVLSKLCDDNDLEVRTKAFDKVCRTDDDTDEQ